MTDPSRRTILRGGAYAALTGLLPAAPALLAGEAVDRTMFLFDAGKPPAGEMPVVLAAGASGILLHEAIGHGMEADFNRKGVSIYASRMNERIAPSFVTVVDNGTLDGSRGAINIDDEANPSERTVLVQDGVLKSYLHDEISAKHYGVAPTGSGRRESFRHPPMPRMRATYMEPGPHKPEEIIASVKNGIYCTSFSNGQVHIGAGDFAFYMKTGYLIEDGKLTRPLKDVNIIGNGPTALERVEMVGDDLMLDEGGWTCGKDGQGVPVSQGPIYDDPLIPRALASRHFDGEGISARPLPIIEAGSLKNLYVDTYYGRKLGMAPTTGSASNRVVTPGAASLAELLRAADRGIYVTSWLGGNSDATTGDFSLGLRGHVIEGGAIGAPIGEMNVTGNLADLFRHLVQLGDDPYPYSSLRAPSLVFEGVQFSGA
jgi:predicted Zn-dependent protease